jgi:hypothetical protein
MVEESKGPEQLAVEGGESGAWPVHEDTSEFEAILSPGASAAVREHEPTELEAGPAGPEAEHEAEHDLAEPDDLDEHDSVAEDRVSLPPVNDEDDDRYGGI